MHRILLRHTYVVIFLQLFSLIGSFHLFPLIVFNTADLLKIPLIFQYRNWSSNNTVYLPIKQPIFQHNNWSSNDSWSSDNTVYLPIKQPIFQHNNWTSNDSWLTDRWTHTQTDAGNDNTRGQNWPRVKMGPSWYVWNMPDQSDSRK